MGKEKASFTYAHTRRWNPGLHPPTAPVAEEELVGETGVAQVVLTWGATIVQSLANSTCPERMKMMTLRKEVNHITHSKSATSWGGPRQVKVGQGAGRAGWHSGWSVPAPPSPIFSLCIRAETAGGPCLPL